MKAETRKPDLRIVKPLKTPVRRLQLLLRVARAAGQMRKAPQPITLDLEDALADLEADFPEVFA